MVNIALEKSKVFISTLQRHLIEALRLQKDFEFMLLSYAFTLLHLWSVKKLPWWFLNTYILPISSTKLNKDKYISSTTLQPRKGKQTY